MPGKFCHHAHRQRYSSSAPAYTSCTKTSRPSRYPSSRCRAPRNLSGEMGRLYCPHQTAILMPRSRTTNLSLAERAVCLPVLTTNAPPRAGSLPHPEHGLFVQRLGRQVPVSRAHVAHPVVGQVVGRLGARSRTDSAGVLMLRRSLHALPRRPEQTAARLEPVPDHSLRSPM